MTADSPPEPSGAGRTTLTACAGGRCTDESAPAGKFPSSYGNEYAKTDVDGRARKTIEIETQPNQSILRFERSVSRRCRAPPRLRKRLTGTSATRYPFQPLTGPSAIWAERREPYPTPRPRGPSNLYGWRHYTAPSQALETVKLPSSAKGISQGTLRKSNVVGRPFPCHSMPRPPPR